MRGALVSLTARSSRSSGDVLSDDEHVRLLLWPAAKTPGQTFADGKLVVAACAGGASPRCDCGVVELTGINSRPGLRYATHTISSDGSRGPDLDKARIGAEPRHERCALRSGGACAVTAVLPYCNNRAV